jgi:hypothetical protein
MTEKYCITYIVEGTVEASNVKEGRRIVEDALLKAFDAEATNISNPEITRVKICVGAGFVTLCGWDGLGTNGKGCE